MPVPPCTGVLFASIAVASTLLAILLVGIREKGPHSPIIRETFSRLCMFTTETHMLFVSDFMERALDIPYPDVSPVWDIGSLGEVAMHFEASVHYQLNTTDADTEWKALVPPNGGLVFAGSDTDGQTYMLSMFHQLHCLDVLRQKYANRECADGLTAHCLNYLRQTIYCRRDLVLEPVIDVEGPHAVQPWKTIQCQDWRQVYGAQEMNSFSTSSRQETGSD